MELRGSGISFMGSPVGWPWWGGVDSGVDRESLGLKDQRGELGLKQRFSTRAILPPGEV